MCSPHTPFLTAQSRTPVVVPRAALEAGARGHREARVAGEARVVLRPRAAPEDAAAGGLLPARVATLRAEADGMGLVAAHGRPARNSAQSTMARRAATARCALG